MRSSSLKPVPTLAKGIAYVALLGYYPTVYNTPTRKLVTWLVQCEPYFPSLNDRSPKYPPIIITSMVSVIPST